MGFTRALQDTSIFESVSIIEALAQVAVTISKYLEVMMGDRLLIKKGLCLSDCLLDECLPLFLYNFATSASYDILYNLDDALVTDNIRLQVFI